MKESLSQKEYSDTHVDTIGVPLLTAVHSNALAMIAPVREKKILDLGCGNGELLSLVSNEGGIGYGIDYDPASIEQAKKVNGASAWIGSIADSLEFEAGFFDAAVSLGTVGYLSEADMAKTFTEVNRVLKQGGKFVVRTPSAINSIGSFVLKAIKKHYVTNTYFYPLSFYKKSFRDAGFDIVSIHRSLDDGKSIRRSLIKRTALSLLHPFLAPVWIQAVKK